jgi:NAD+ synthase (glutamine-hydrolysing)
MTAAAHPFFYAKRHGFVRVAACTPKLLVAEPAFNAAETLAMAREGHAQAVDVMVFPELGISAYSIDDLHLQDALLDAVEREIAGLAEASAALTPLLLVGAPVRRNGRVYNCAVAIHGGRVLGVVPKSYLPNYREYYEKRWFAEGFGLVGLDCSVDGRTVPFGTDLLFQAAGRPDFTVAAELCEDFWAPIPPSTRAALAGATVLCNLSASNVVIGKADERALLCASQSVRAYAAYVYSASGPGESTTDLAWDGQATIHELGALLAATPRFPTASHMAVADVDLERLRNERARTGTFNDCAAAEGHPERSYRVVPFDWRPVEGDVGLMRKVDRFPYVPDDPSRLDQDCFEAFNIQVQGLAKRIQATGSRTLVIGVSGGLDSTHALLVACRTFDLLGLPRTGIRGYTLPGFATGEATKANAWRLMRALGVTAEEIDIRPAALRMLEDIGHPFAAGEPVHDVTFENVQAGLRTDYLFRLANRHGGFVLGTGDLSELALGWATYGVGDHMSHYNVNASVAKTLVQHLIRWVAATGLMGIKAAPVLAEIVEQEISPELVPAGADGAMQSTEAKVGPYALQDFTLYHMVRYGFRPSKIAFLAWRAWRDAAAGDWPPHHPERGRLAYDLPEIKRWMELFLRRFFANQFKRSAVPNAPKVATGGSLSPRGDWRMPSDASAAAWLDELEANVPDLPLSALPGESRDPGRDGQPAS